MTIVDIAKESGYSVSTVSRVLNGRQDVSAKARNRILAIVEARKFVPNNNAKHLKQAASKSILILVKGTSNMLFASLIESLQSIFEESDYPIRIHYLDEDSNEVSEAVRICREHKPMGVLFLGGNETYFKEQFERIHVPCVLVTNRGNELGFPNLSSVATDDAAAAEEVVDYLFDHGHTDIAVVGGERNLSSTSIERYMGCCNSFSKHGRTFDDRYYATARYSYDSAYAAMNRLLDKGVPISAVFAMSDVMAVGAIRAIYDRGLKVPEDISMIGFDGTLLADYYNPKIVTIRQDYELMAVRSVEILLGMVNLNYQAVHELIPFELKNTESVIQYHS
ncbi:MAG: LacI family transcriptional regulator [Blautia sp.]|nr:LacI family transcriptional regulator [Blautia sp.]